MQLTIITLMVAFFLYLQQVKAQIRSYTGSAISQDSVQEDIEILNDAYVRPDWKKINVDFLSSYYAQDGNNGAVTGGVGTEQLTDFTQKLAIDFSTSEKLRWSTFAAYDYYSSASTDNIDNIRSSDSSADMRTQVGVGMQYSANEQNTIGARLGSSIEYDYVSVNGGLNYSWLSHNKNSQLSFNAQAFFDTWSLIYPRELRGSVSLPRKDRQSYNGSISWNQVINQKLHSSIILEATYMTGLLSTPFHRVYFADKSLPDIERLPESRLKLPIAARINWHMSESMIIRTFYRLYWDSWGMQGHTFNIETPIKIGRFIAVYPHYRYHTQTAIDYFKIFKEHNANDVYYTSDHDLSDLHTHTYGIGLQYGSAKGIFDIKLPLVRNRHIKLETIDMKFSHFDRSTGLKANIFSIGFKFTL